MTISAAPLPTVGHLVRALTAAESAGEPWLDERRKYLPHIYRRGGLALAAGVEAARQSSGAAVTTVWVPGYFCNEALEAVRRLPVKLEFYPVRENLAPDWDQLKPRADVSLAGQIFLLVHYFGFPNATCKAQAFCDQNGMILFEDSAHMLRMGTGVGYGQMMIFSPRKVLAVPFGGILLMSGAVSQAVEPPAGGHDWFETVGWVIRRIIQKILLAFRFPWHLLMNYQEAAANPVVEPSTQGDREVGCNSYGLRLLAVTARDMRRVMERRRRNYARLLGWVGGLSRAQPLFPSVPDDVCPYAFPLLIKDGCEEAVVKLQSTGVLASRWPDLPPEVLTMPSRHEVAFKTYERLLLIPIHQTLSLKQIDFEGRRLRAVLGAG